MKTNNNQIDVTNTESNEILQENHYYPFGMNMQGAWINDIAGKDNKYQYNGKEYNDDFGLNWNDYGARWYDASIGRWHAVDPLADMRPGHTPYHYCQNNPINRIDPTGALDWHPDENGNLVADAGDNAYTLSNYLNISVDQSLEMLSYEGITPNSKGVLNLKVGDQISSNSIGQTIMNGGFETFINVYETLGEDFFFNAANSGFNDNATGIMAFARNNVDGVGDGIRLSQMTHSWVDAGGWSESRNKLEHEIGMFLMAERFGQNRAMAIGDANELRGLFINDRQSGNMWNALLGRGGTAFEWRDMENNLSGINKWREYHGLSRLYQGHIKLPEVGSMEWHIVK